MRNFLRDRMAGTETAQAQTSQTSLTFGKMERAPVAV